MIKKAMLSPFFLTSFFDYFKTAFLLLVLLITITGGLYPLLITGLAQILFPFQANGSLINKNGRVIGSELIGQFFDDPKYFWGRPSATKSFPYNAAASGGSNLGPTNPELLEVIKIGIKALQKYDPQSTTPIPIELLTASGSGLDPHITSIAALYQIKRISKARHLSEEALKSLIFSLAEKRQFGFLGEPRVNVLKLNLALDNLSDKKIN